MEHFSLTTVYSMQRTSPQMCAALQVGISAAHWAPSPSCRERVRPFQQSYGFVTSLWKSIKAWEMLGGKVWSLYVYLIGLWTLKKWLDTMELSSGLFKSFISRRKPTKTLAVEGGVSFCYGSRVQINRRKFERVDRKIFWVRAPAPRSASEGQRGATQMAFQALSGFNRR